MESRPQRDSVDIRTVVERPLQKNATDPRYTVKDLHANPPAPIDATFRSKSRPRAGSPPLSASRRSANCALETHLPKLPEPPALVVRRGHSRQLTVEQEHPCPHDTAPERDASFIALLNAYRSTGGLLRGDDLADLQAMRGQGDRVVLARSIVAGEILCFEWNRTFWVPAFQLDRDSLLVGSGARSVLAELSRAFDSWLAAQWFVAPNAWLRGGAPVDLMVSDLPAVLDAARADCFIATG